ncbi:class I SAM-dependent methyltransferase [Inquilinus sp. CAU 1745]|uniref:class I SAM-dependent methyltransferase n=1 Tax=Inquilinus sp. CAU 1745 TaxID=3140369 RepID=UPI00325B0583
MLQGLSRMLPTIETEALDEAAVYRMERLYARTAAPGKGAPGVLECPICNRTALRFLPFGLGGRRNAMCPTCGSVERHRFLWLYLTTRTDLLTGRHRVLHTAPETALEERLRGLPNLRYESVDRFNPYADRQADLTDLPYGDGTFDVVLTSHVLEHIPDDRKAMAELARVTRRGGRAVVMVPYTPKEAVSPEGRDIASPAERMARFGHPYHYRYYGRDLVDRLADAGFEAKGVSSRQMLSPHRRRRFRINANWLFHCIRR